MTAKPSTTTRDVQRALGLFQKPAKDFLALNPTAPPGAPAGPPAARKQESGAKLAKWTFTVPGAVMGKPRMTQRDKWQKRDCVVRFRAWADSAMAAAPADLTSEPLTVSWTAWLPMPDSWSKKRKAAMTGTLHRQKPDRDNIDKGVLDALFNNDCGVAAGTLVKRWDDGQGPRIVIEVTA